MHWHRLIPFIPLGAALVLACATDLRGRRIPNWLTVPLMLAGLMQSWNGIGPGSSFLGLLVGGALSLPLFILGIRGGGDLKLLAAVGAWLGPKGALLVFVASTIAGMGLALIQCLIQGRLLRLFQRTMAVALSVAHVRVIGVESAAATLGAERVLDRRMPYALAILAGTCAVLWRVAL